MVTDAKKFILFFLVLMFAAADVFPANGTIKGNVYDIDTKLYLIGANILIMNSNQGAATDIDGNFVINNVPPGTYALRFSYIGYAQITKTDIIVRPDRITYVDAGLKSSGYQMDSIVVSSGYFLKKEEQPTSLINFSYEEIRRAPGSAGDVSRILMSLPSIAKVNDQSNSLIVRGGAPSENAFYIDNIEVPNINHFPVQASTGGPIGMLNVDFIKDLNFYSGGFSALYGNRLSSVMEINFREGNRDEFDGQLDLNFSGFGGVFEGPLPGNGSWMVSARRSYLDFLIKAIDLGTSTAPRYSDYQWKVIYNLNKTNKLSFIGLMGDDMSESDEKTAEENKMEMYGKQKYLEGTAGINWQAIWGSSGYSNTSFSFSTMNFDESYYKSGLGYLAVDNNSKERELKFRNVNHFQVGLSSLDIGIDGKYHFNSYNNFYNQFVDANGNLVGENRLNKNIRTGEAAVFVNYTVSILDEVILSAGLRGNYFAYSKALTFDPRVSLKYKLSDITALNGSFGIFHQNLPMLLLAQNEQAKSRETKATHYIIGIDHLLSEDTKLTLEVYNKEYFNFPVDPSLPSLFIIDENIYGNRFYSYHENLLNTGRAYSRGVEITLQKKLAKDFYGLASASLFKTRYKAADGIWRDRAYDNQVLISFEGGYKPNNEWEFSSRWIFAGGSPYTPFNVKASKNFNTGILDENKVNEERYPPYHSLNVRVDKRFLFDNSNLVVYISIWNAYSRQNIAHYFWNSFKNEQDTIYQWTLLPIFGIEYEF